MNVKRIIGTGLVLSMVASIGLVLGAPNAAHASHEDGFSSSGDTQTVDCDGFFNTSINRAIQRSDLGRRLTINVKGTCVENVVIDRDWVTLQPSGFGGGSIEAADDSKATILISGRHVTVQDFDGASISGGNNGVTVIQGGAASILNNHITRAVRDGVNVGLNSSVFIEGNQIDLNGRRGVHVHTTSSAILGNNEIVLNGNNGLSVATASTVHINDGNIFSNNERNGIQITLAGGVFINGAQTIQRNNGNGITCGVFSMLIVEDLALIDFGTGGDANGSGSGIPVNPDPTVCQAFIGP